MSRFIAHLALTEEVRLDRAVTSNEMVKCCITECSSFYHGLIITKKKKLHVPCTCSASKFVALHIIVGFKLMELKVHGEMCHWFSVVENCGNFEYIALLDFHQHQTI